MALLEKDLAVRNSIITGAGKGLFTTVDIPKGTRIVEYKGDVATWDQVRADATNAYIYFLKPNYVIDARNHPKALARYVNDAHGLSRKKDRHNNAQFVPDGLRVFIVATRDIASGEEILVEYGRQYWDAVRKNAAVDKANKT